MDTLEDHPADDPRSPRGQVPPWVPLSKGGVDLTQVYELLRLTPAQRVEKLTQAIDALARLRAQTRAR